MQNVLQRRELCISLCGNKPWKMMVRLLCWPHVKLQWQNSSRDAENGTIGAEQSSKEECADSLIFIQVTSFFPISFPYVLPSDICRECRFRRRGFLNSILFMF